jgi:hypothetical protein
MKRSLFLVLLLGIFLTGQAIAGDDAPGWLRQASLVKPPTYEKDVPAVVLQDEQQAAYGQDGKIVVTETCAIRVLNREGKSRAVAIAPYLVSSGKVRDINAWLIRPDGTVKKYEKNAVLDMIADQDDVYNEGRYKMIDASDDADTGAVFGYQIVSEDRPLWYQDTWMFQDRLPTLSSRYSLSLPAGWKASSITFNSAAVQPQVNGSTYTWQMSNLQPIPPEVASPSVRNLAPRLVINYFPEAAGSAVGKNFTDWTDVSRWVTGLHESQVIVDDAVAGKTRELIINAKTEMERIRAIANYVQNLQYISIDIGVGYGNGIRPRASNLVLSRGYGDCKDKANLMRAMLKSINIEAYPIAIYSGDPNYVREEWSSPGQFNHCIIAVKVSDATQAPTVINNPKLGRLMIFDATDPFTPVGDLPEQLQGSLALLAAGDNGSLIKMPLITSESNKLNRQTELTLDPMGNLSGTIKERSVGQAARQERALKRSLSPSEYNKRIERWIVNGISTARLSKIEPNDLIADGRFELDVDITAAAYAQIMQDRLMIFKPAVVSRLNSLWLTEPKRVHPIMLEPYAFTESSVIKLPAGFIVDEMPEPVKLETSFGKYSTTYELKDGKLLFNRSLVMNYSQIPADKYDSVKDFFVKMRIAEQAAVVLVKR